MTQEPDSLSDEERAAQRIRRQRNIAMALMLGAFVILVYAISIVKMNG